MIATIVGGTGMTGSSVLRRLVADTSITQVISVARRPLSLPSNKVTEVLLADLAQLSSLAAHLRGDLYFCCLGTTMKAAGSKDNFEKVDHDAVVAFARIAREHEAHSLTLVSAMGANTGSLFFYNRVKGRTEDDVRALALRSLTILRPGLLVGSRKEVRLGEQIAGPVMGLLPRRMRKKWVTPVDVLAERIVAEGKAAVPGVRVISAQDI